MVDKFPISEIGQILKKYGVFDEKKFKSEGMDLLYFDDGTIYDVSAHILKEKGFKVVDASDEIHDFRLEVRYEDYDCYLKTLEDNELVPYSMNGQMTLNEAERKLDEKKESAQTATSPQV